MCCAIPRYGLTNFLENSATFLDERCRYIYYKFLTPTISELRPYHLIMNRVSVKFLKILLHWHVSKQRQHFTLIFHCPMGKQRQQCTISYERSLQQVLLLFRVIFLFRTGVCQAIPSPCVACFYPFKSIS